MTSPVSARSETADPFAAQERQRAVRLLLRHPFVTDRQPDAETFALVRRHGAWLQAWFRDQLGYRLAVETEQARLHKRPAPHPLPRPARSRSGAPFERRRYTLLCLLLAALERTEMQTVLTALAEEVKVLAAAEPRIAAVDFERYAERQAFVDALRFLVDLDVLRLTDGDDSAFLDRSGDALYDVDGRRLAQVLSTTVPPSLVAGAGLDPEALVAEVYPPTDEGRNLRIRHRLMRQLLEEPVLARRHLEAAEEAYLTSQRHYLLRQIATATGLPVEVRAEGLAVIDAQGEMTDLAFPATGTLAHAALLLADLLAAPGRAAPAGRVTVPHATLQEEVAGLVARYGRHWSRAYREAPRRLLADALERLAAMGLVVVRAEGVEPLPPCARFRAAALPARRDESSETGGLFD